MSNLEIKQLRKNYGNQKVLKGINISFDSQEIHGIIGSNGAGKSTFFECICGLKNFKGEISSNHNPLKNQIAYLPTTPFFFPKITGREYLNFILKISKKKNYSIKELTEVFNLPLTKYVESYSTGMKKKNIFFRTIIIGKINLYIR